MSGKKEKKYFIVGIIMVAIIVAATATIIYCYINRFDPQEYVQAFLDVSYKTDRHFRERSKTDFRR